MTRITMVIDDDTVTTTSYETDKTPDTLINLLGQGSAYIVNELTAQAIDLGAEQTKEELQQMYVAEITASITNNLTEVAATEAPTRRMTWRKSNRQPTPTV